MVFDAPTKDWAGRRNAPTVDVYLYDIREDLRRRERGLINEYDGATGSSARHLPPRHFKLSYLVTAWTQRPEDEHRLLSALLPASCGTTRCPHELLTRPAGRDRPAGAGDGRPAAAGGPLLRRRLVRARRRAEAVARRRGQRADRHRAAVRGRAAGQCRRARRRRRATGRRRAPAARCRRSAGSATSDASGGEREADGAAAGATARDRAEPRAPAGPARRRRGPGPRRWSRDRRADDPAPDDPFRGLYLHDEASTSCSPASRRPPAPGRRARPARGCEADGGRGRGRRRRRSGCASWPRTFGLTDARRRAAAGRARCPTWTPVRAALRLPQRRRHPAPRVGRPGAASCAGVPPAAAGARARLAADGAAGRRRPAGRRGPRPAVPDPGAAGAGPGRRRTCSATTPPTRRWSTGARRRRSPPRRRPADRAGRGAGAAASRLVYLRERPAAAARRLAAAALRGGRRGASPLDLDPARRRPTPASAPVPPSRSGRRCCAAPGWSSAPVEALADARRRTGSAPAAPSAAVPVLLVGDRDLGPALDGRQPAAASTRRRSTRRRAGRACGARDAGATGAAGLDAAARRRRSLAARRPSQVRPGRRGRPRARPPLRRRGRSTADDLRARRPGPERRRPGAAGPADRARGRLGRPRAAADAVPRSCSELAARARHRDQVLDRLADAPAAAAAAAA